MKFNNGCFRDTLPALPVQHLTRGVDSGTSVRRKVGVSQLFLIERNLVLFSRYDFKVQARCSYYKEICICTVYIIQLCKAEFGR